MDIAIYCKLQKLTLQERNSEIMLMCFNSVFIVCNVSLLVPRAHQMLDVTAKRK